MNINWLAVLEHFMQGFVWATGASLAFFIVLWITGKGSA